MSLDTKKSNEPIKAEPVPGLHIASCTAFLSGVHLNRARGAIRRMGIVSPSRYNVRELSK